MLVLSRKGGQSIDIADGLITITIVKKTGTRVKIGIVAPSRVPIWRQELGTPTSGASGNGGMLVLSRKIGESICIGTSVTITVIDVQGSSIRIGIQAPVGIRVLRRELVAA